jgi:hypothetical protein
MKAPTLALVNHLGHSAYKMQYVAHHETQNRVLLPVGSVHPVTNYLFECRPREALYFSGIKVKAVEGELPVGKILVKADGEVMLSGDLRAFGEDPDPGKTPWLLKDKGLLFTASPATPPYDWKVVVGHFLPNGTMIKVYLELPDDEKGELEVTLLGEKYQAIDSLPMEKRA